jgi:hypothetical protein
MNTFFLLLDTTTGNMVTEFDTEDEVIEILGEVQSNDGEGALLEYALFRYEGDHPTLVARKHDLVSYVARGRRRRQMQVVEAVVNAPNRKTATTELFDVEIQGDRVHLEGNRWAFSWTDLAPCAVPFGRGPITAVLRLEGGACVAAA